MFGFRRNSYDSSYDRYGNQRYGGYGSYNRNNSYMGMGGGAMNPMLQQMMVMMQQGGKGVDPEMIKQMQLMDPQMLQQLAETDPRTYKKFMKRMYKPSLFKQFSGVAKSFLARLDDKDDYDEQEPAFSKKVLAQKQVNPITGEGIPSPVGKNREQYKAIRLAEIAKRAKVKITEDDGSVSSKAMNNKAGRNLLKEKMAQKIKEKSDVVISAAGMGLSKVTNKASDVIASAGKDSIISEVLGEKGKKIVSGAGKRLADSIAESSENRKMKMGNVIGFDSREDLITEAIELKADDLKDISKLEPYVLYSIEITSPTIIDFVRGTVYTNRVISNIEIQQERKVKFLESNTVCGERVSISRSKVKVKSTGEIKEILKCTALESDHIYPATVMISLTNDIDKRFEGKMREINCESLYIGIPKGSYAILNISLRKHSQKLLQAYDGGDTVIQPQEFPTDQVSEERFSEEQY